MAFSSHDLDATAALIDRICAIRERALLFSYSAIPNVRVHDQFHPEAKAPPGALHDEQRPRKLHDPTSKSALDPKNTEKIYPSKFEKKIQSNKRSRFVDIIQFSFNALLLTR